MCIRLAEVRSQRSVLQQLGTGSLFYGFAGKELKRAEEMNLQYSK